MARRMIAVDDDNGTYQFALGAESQPYRRADHDHVTVVEGLMGWAPWRWAISTADWVEDGEPPTVTHFVTGESEPKGKAPLGN